jgi:hypothetical protein
MIRQLWLNAVKSSYRSYIKQIEKCSTDKKFSDYLKQKLDLDMTLEEFSEMVFIQGFAAGEQYARKVPLPKGTKVEMN